MKVIDEKGKLFGKINLIDLLVVLVILAVIVGVFWKLAGDEVSDAIAPTTKTTMEYEVLCTAVPADAALAAEAVSVGQQLMSNGGLLNATVTACVVEPYITTNVDAEGNSVAVTDQARNNVRFTITAELASGDKTNSVGSQEVRIGKSHIVKTTEVEITGTVTKVAINNG